MPWSCWIMRMDRRVLRLTVTKADDRSKRIRTNGWSNNMNPFSNRHKNCFCGVLHFDAKLFRIMEVVLGKKEKWLILHRTLNTFKKKEGSWEEQQKSIRPIIRKSQVQISMMSQPSVAECQREQNWPCFQGWKDDTSSQLTIRSTLINNKHLWAHLCKTVWIVFSSEYIILNE